MLFDIDSGQEVNYIPHQNNFNLWRSRLSEKEFDSITDKLNSLIDKDEIHTSSWIPGNNWSNTVFEPIYAKACNMDENLSGLCFGLFVWYVFQERDDEWYFGRFEKDGFPIKGMTYFRKKS